MEVSKKEIGIVDSNAKSLAQSCLTKGPVQKSFCTISKSITKYFKHKRAKEVAKFWRSFAWINFPEWNFLNLSQPYCCVLGNRFS